MDTLDENNDHIDIGLLYEELVKTYHIDDENIQNELTPEVYELFKEAELNLSDELAELDYEGNPQGVIRFLNMVTDAVVKFNTKRN